MSERVFNFSAGPAVMPLPVLERIRDEIVTLPGAGMSVLEMSHRSAACDEIFEEAEMRLRRVLGVPDGYSVLFLQGGAQLQFSMIPINFLCGQPSAASYLVTGTWGGKGVTQAEREGRVEVVWSGSDENWTRVPEDGEYQVAEDSVYMYYVSNETIQGVQFQDLPSAGDVPLICDASSDFLSRPVDIERHAMYYACAQKNAGPSGLTVVVIENDFMNRAVPEQHPMLDYRAHAKAGSRLNTPPVFGVWAFLLVLRWLEDEMGGLAAMAEHNKRKAALLYEVLDEDSSPEPFYLPHAQKASRSRMNVTFRTANALLDGGFLEGAAERGLVTLKGHRSVGGVRASIYNAMPVAGVERLAAWMREFRGEHT